MEPDAIGHIFTTTKRGTSCRKGILSECKTEESFTAFEDQSGFAAYWQKLEATREAEEDAAREQREANAEAEVTAEREARIPVFAQPALRAADHADFVEGVTQHMGATPGRQVED